MLRVAFPELVTVTDWAELDTFTIWFPKLSEVVESETAGAGGGGGVLLLPPPPHPTKTMDPIATARKRLNAPLGSRLLSKAESSAVIEVCLIAPPPP
jgi:hypothetical protein